FYRRVLSSTERKEAWSKLGTLWGIKQTDYWYPLDHYEADNVEAFQAPYFDKEVGSEKLRAILQNHGVERVLELREYGPEYELELSAFEPYYNGAEGYWCSEQMDWILYASHESSITIGGEWLLRRVKDIW